MPAIAKRAVDSDFARLRSEHLENLGHHNRPMHPRRSFAGGNNLLDGVGILVRIQLFILLLKPARMRAPVTGATLVRRGFRTHSEERYRDHRCGRPEFSTTFSFVL